LQLAAVRLAEVVTRALDVRRYALGVSGVTLVEELPADLPVTWGDPARLQQAVLHLVTRAEHATREWRGMKRLSLRLSRVANALVLVVEDSGPGIAAADLERLFSPGVTMREGLDLAGLGLAVAEGIVREHGGRIHVDSTPGDGATFVVEIPITPAPDEAPPVRIGATDEGDASSLDILVVDDEPAIRAALARMLERLGHRVTLAADGEEARRAVEALRLDRIILDLRMPRLGGEALFAELKARRPDLVPRVVFLTGDLEREAAQQLARDSGLPALSKPFTLEDVRRLAGAAAQAVEGANAMPTS
jgi:CheY-like chemotaxis protein